MNNVKVLFAMLDKSMSVQSKLRTFYDAQAEKYFLTRNKHRADADIFLHEIQSCNKKTINILEFGCWSGRLLAHLGNIPWIKIHYTGVDLSKNLLAIAKKQFDTKNLSMISTAKFVCDDILTYITWCKQESFDFVIGIASFQHIPTVRERFFLTKNIYRILKYNGKIMMSNRSFSRRFIKKYQKNLIDALRKYIVSFGKHQRNDIMIPRKHENTIVKRFYHIYTLAELKKFIALSGFIIDTLWYLGHTWMVHSSRKDAKNTLVIGTKTIFRWKN